MSEKNMTPSEFQARNQNFLKDYLSDDQSIRKTAAADLDKWLRTYQRQDGVWRRVIPPTPVTEADFGEAVDTRDPFVIRQIMPRSMGAMTVNFDTGTATTSMYADKYQIFLHRIFTPKYRIDKIYLLAYKGDLIAIFKDLSLQDILATEDVLGRTMMNVCIGTKHTVNPDIGIKQYIDAGLTVTPDSVIHGVKGLTLSTDNLNPAQAIVHRSFWWEIIAAFKADDYGDKLAESAVLGDTKLLEESLAGITWRTVLDRDLIPMNTMYVLAAPEYCGEFLTYEEANIFTKVEDNLWFEMFAHETVGMSFPYRGCVTRADFGQAAAEDWLTESSSSSSSSL